MNLAQLQEQAQAVRQQQSAWPMRVGVCVASSCLSKGSAAVLQQAQESAPQGCHASGIGCSGLCTAGPVVRVWKAGEERLLKEVHPQQGSAVWQSEYPLQQLDLQHPFFTGQQRIVTENCGRIDPLSLDDYLAAEGYVALLESLERRNPAQVLDEVVRSGLRGRGGAGYPTGLKWQTVAKASGQPKYVVCNADEGDPGAYMDRSVMESDPFKLIEGMTLAAYAVGASFGYIYVRAEYLLAVERLQNAIHLAERAGLLGSRIGGTDFAFHIEIRLGAGAYVCGEETALIASIEGKRGQPRPRPPYPAESGLFGCPTLINNVETLANIPPILRKGGAWMAAIGTAKSKGTKVFALAGDVCNSGLVEVPMGTPLRYIVNEMGGGVPGGKAFKAVQTGGPSGGCIPAEQLDAVVDYEVLAELGSIMGSGGMVVMDEHTCMVDLARFFLGFCRDESCGKCVPCRVGTAQLYQLLDKFCHHQANASDLDLLEELCDLVKHTSLCGLGQSAPNPVLSTLRYFRNEYLAHQNGHCPAGICLPEVAV